MINGGDTAWVLTATALVMLMTPGLALFYGGLVRRKNVLSILMQCMFILALVSVTWVLVGYTLAFGPDVNGWGIIGNLDNVGLKGVGVTPISYAPTVPGSAFALFQMMFAIITPALIIGAFAERKRFKAFVLFALLWSLLVYSPIAHWVWGEGGWLRNMGVLDFAGGTVVHISSGVAALVAALVLGPRVRRESERFEPHDVRLTVIGAGILWFGWFGFNGGSALAANGLAVNAVLVTNTAAGMGALTWLTMSWLHKGSPSVIGAVSGAIAGEVGHHAGLGLRGPELGHRDRVHRRRGLLRSDPPSRAGEDRRRARRLGGPRRRRHAGRPADRRLRHDSHQHGHQQGWPDRRQPGPDRDAARSHRRGLDLQRRGNFRDPQGRGPGRGSSRRRIGRGGRPGCFPARRGGRLPGLAWTSQTAPSRALERASVAWPPRAWEWDAKPSSTSRSSRTATRPSPQRYQWSTRALLISPGTGHRLPISEWDEGPEVQPKEPTMIAAAFLSFGVLVIGWFVAPSRAKAEE